MFGILHDLTSLFTEDHTLKTARDVDCYIQRLHAIPAFFQQILATLDYQKDRGIIPPRFTVEKVIDLINKTLTDRSDEHIFYTHLAQALNSIDTSQRAAFLTQAKQAIQDAVQPAYRLVQQYFVQLLDTAQTNNGVWALADGNEYYAYMLAEHTTTNLSPEEIHRIGLQEVAQIHAHMRSLLAAENIVDPSKSVGILMQELAKDPRFYYPNTDQGREQCLAEYQAILERSRKELGHLFNIKPRAGVQIQRVPPQEEEGAPGAYYHRPSADGSRPGIFFANLRDMNEEPTYGMETLTIHEAEPGHHFQIALQQEMDIPLLRKFGDVYTAYVEGWALYVEKLAYEHDFYSSSCAQLGHLQAELLRAVRLVVDTGIHYKRWTREQAIAYMQEATGFHYNSVVTEIERYFVLPGQACAYKIGQLKILELRKRAQDKLGAAFDIREFHDVVLKVAAVPLAILEEVVEQYIQDKGKTSR